MTLVAPDLAERVIARALARGGDLGELYAEDRRGFALTLDDERVERPQLGRERGASVRVISGQSSYFGYVDGLAEEDMLRVADSVAEAAAGDAREPAALAAATRAAGHLVEQAPEDVDAQTKATLLRAAEEAARRSVAFVCASTSSGACSTR